MIGNMQQQQPSGSRTTPNYFGNPSSSSPGLPSQLPPPLPQKFRGRNSNAGQRISLDEHLAANLNQNLAIFGREEPDMAGLGIGKANPWQLSSTIGSTNGFTGSDSSAPLSPTSQNSSANYWRKNNMNSSNLNSQLQRVARNQGAPLVRNNRPSNNNSQNANILGNTTFHRARLSSQSYSNPKVSSQQSSTPFLSKSSQSRNGDGYHCGMRDLTYWLKKLRLHKYTPLFEMMTYPEMMSLNNETLERLKVTAGARKKIVQSIEKLRERPAVLRNMEKGLLRREQCIRCAICSIRQMLWSPFMKYETNGCMKKKAQSVDGLNVPLHLIPDENMPALLFRLIELLNKMIFPMNPLSENLEDEYLLTMFQIFDSVLKNDQFTNIHQRLVFNMKKNARNYASPEEMRKHRMGMVSSDQCERCHHTEVVNRDRLIEMRERQEKQARGENVALLPACNAFYDSFQEEMPMITSDFDMVVQQRVQHKRPADNQFDFLSSSAPKITAATASQSTSSASSSSTLLDDYSAINGIFAFRSIWADNNKNIWQADDQDKELLNTPSTSITSPLSLYPEYRSPSHLNSSTIYSSDDLNLTTEQQQPTTQEYRNVMNQSTFDFLALLKDMPKERNDISFSQSSNDLPGLKNKANSTGSGYSSSDSESSVVSPRSRSLSGDTQKNGSSPTPTASVNEKSILSPLDFDIATLLSSSSSYSQYYKTNAHSHPHPQFM